jgi:glycosyltransferase involved in cell wall biosynthesis
MKRSRLLFCGELPPATINGISISNRRILEVLAERFEILRVEERRNLENSRLSFFHKVSRILVEVFEVTLSSLQCSPEIFYTSFPTSIFGGAKCLLFVMLFRTFARGRIILHVHRGDLVSFHQRGALPRFLVKTCFSFSTTVLSLSNLQSIAYAEITKTPVLAIPNSVTYDNKIVWRNPASTRLIFLSNFLPNKGLDTLLDAFKELRKTQYVELHCYGGGDSAHYVSRVASEAIPDVSIHGVLEEQVKYETLTDFSVLVMPSYNEGQPLVILEAMAIGLPVVASNIGLISEMLGDDYPYLVEPNNAHALTKALESCLSLPRPEALASILRDRFQKLYSPESQRVRILEAFTFGSEIKHEG